MVIAGRYNASRHLRSWLRDGRAQHPLTALVGQPMSVMTPADFSAVTRALRFLDLFPATRPVLELLAACLEHRFGGDVAIGESASAPEADAISLSARDGS
jgi:hypothetical protein